ncbi:hypothetical protein LguiA_027596 [Lonicera macranthoides]
MVNSAALQNCVFYAIIELAKARSEVKKYFLSAGDCETTHWMIKGELFLSLT